MVAVGGDSGTGKTTITRGLYDIFGAENIVNICLDDYHSLDRAQRRERGITALDPRANDLALMEKQIAALRRSEAVAKPVYDHSDGSFGPAEVVEPRAIVIVRGLFPLYNPALRAAFDISVWLDPDPALRMRWKVQRDVAQRGYTIDQVLRELETRRPDSERHIAPQKAHADVVVTFRAPAGEREDADGHLDVSLSLKGHLPRLELGDILADEAASARPAIRAGADRSSSTAPEVLEVDGAISPERAAALEERIWEHMHSHRHLRPDELGTFLDGTRPRHSDPLALAQLLLAYLIVRRRDQLAAAVGGAAIKRQP